MDDKARVGNRGRLGHGSRSNPPLYQHHHLSPTIPFNLALNLTGVLRSLGCTYLSLSGLDLNTYSGLACNGEKRWDTKTRRLDAYGKD